jgi:hypothetical protein
VVNRGVLFAVRGDDFVGIGQFGLHFPDASADERVRSLRIPRHEPTVLAAASDSGTTFQGQPAATRWNRILNQHLGGGEPHDVVVVPLLVDGAVVAVLHGDNLPGSHVVGAVDGLEILMHEVGLAVERARLEQRVERLGKSSGP